MTKPHIKGTGIKALLQIQFPVNVPETQMLVQRPASAPPTWEIRVMFLAPGFSFAQL